MEIRSLRRRDAAKAVRFAIKGMHFDWYLEHAWALAAFGWYFWLKERCRATQVLAAYEEGRFAGVLLAEAYGETVQKRSWLARSYVALAEAVMALFFKGGPDLYERTAAELDRRYRQRVRPDGEILFLAVDPAFQGRGVGSALLSALAAAEPGKTFFLQTDNACTYQFYDQRGFVRAEEASIVLEMPKGKIPLDCFLYSKTFDRQPSCNHSIACD